VTGAGLKVAADEVAEPDGFIASPGARANAVVAARFALWALLVAGPLLGVLALQRPAVTASPVEAPVVPADVVTGDPAGAAGFAALFVAAHIETEVGTELWAFYAGAS
jgi:hypothetical protein